MESEEQLAAGDGLLVGGPSCRNDFCPFLRAELKQHDPVLVDLLEEIWGPVE